jgi:hypothetical protein
LLELNENNLKRATVFILHVDENGGEPIISCVGSGTLVSAEGLILTNAHVVVESPQCRGGRLVIALSLRLDDPPVPSYLAEVLDYSPGLDLAVLQITRFLDGRVAEKAQLQLPFVELGDSDAVALDDTVLVVGYSDIGETPVQSLRGTISGFTAEARSGDRAWLRTLAPIPGLMAGAGAYDRSGRLIGIPTIVPALVGDQVVDCRNVQDTNGDGLVNDLDRCLPIGGFISALRPAELARGLVRAASLGIGLGQDFAPAQFPLPSDPPSFSRLFISTGVNAADMPVNVVYSLPAGARSFYLFFDYDNLVNGMIYELRTSVDGRPSPNFSLPSVPWNGGERGMWYIGSSGLVMANGLYTFTLFIQGRQVATLSLAVGGGPQQVPSFSDLSFGLQDGAGGIVGKNFILPETNIIRAEFNFRNMRPDLTWTQVWYLENTELTRTSLPWTAGEEGVNNEPAIQSPAGLLSGEYRLELYINDQLALSSNFVIAGGAEGVQAAIFSNMQFSSEQVGGQPAGLIGAELPNTISDLYLFFDWRQLSQGTPWTWRWLVDNELLFESHTQWAANPDGAFYFLSLEGQPSLIDATYTLEVEMGGIIVLSQQARVGTGQLPLGVFADAEGITLNGQIVDAETKDGIAGALFIMLLPQFSIEDFLWDAGQVLAISYADKDGFFQLPVLLGRGTEVEPQLYSYLVRADGYLPISLDGLAVTEYTASPIELIIEMNRD